MGQREWMLPPLIAGRWHESMYPSKKYNEGIHPSIKKIATRFFLKYHIYITTSSVIFPLFVLGNWLRYDSIKIQKFSFIILRLTRRNEKSTCNCIPVTIIACLRILALYFIRLYGSIHSLKYELLFD